MDYTHLGNVASWKHLDVNANNPECISKKLEHKLYLVQTTKGNQYYIDVLKNKGAHLFPFNESHFRLKKLQVDWITWDQLCIEDQTDFKNECQKRNWTFFDNKCKNIRRLEIVFK